MARGSFLNNLLPHHYDVTGDAGEIPLFREKGRTVSRKNYDKANRQRHYDYKAYQKNLPNSMNKTISTECSTGKFQYPTRTDAKRAARELKEINQQRRAMTAYICGVCGCFHIGHSNRVSW